VNPGANELVWTPSPNYNERQDIMDVRTIVLHHTANATLSGVVKWFEMPESQVSSHFTIGRDGSIAQHVSTFKRAWHAGVSLDHLGREGLNDFSVGIEIVNVGDGSMEYPPEQVEAVRHLVAVLLNRFPEIDSIVSHEYIAEPQGRKPDPINYPWDSLREFGVPLVYGLKDGTSASDREFWPKEEDRVPGQEPKE
jgi:N-acetyl-anhydromuramyl-L-alanine amidase AmpD